MAKKEKVAKKDRQKKAAKTDDLRIVAAVYVDDTKNFHTYRVAPGQDCYGSFGFGKEAEVPKRIVLELVPGGDPRRKAAIEKMLEGMRDGRAKDRLIAALN